MIKVESAKEIEKSKRKKKLEKKGKTGVGLKRLDETHQEKLAFLCHFLFLCMFMLHVLYYGLCTALAFWLFGFGLGTYGIQSSLLTIFCLCVLFTCLFVFTLLFLCLLLLCYTLIRGNLSIEYSPCRKVK